MIRDAAAIPTLQGRALWYTAEHGRSQVAGWDSGSREPIVCPADACDLAVLGACDASESLEQLADTVRLPRDEVARVLAGWQQRMPASLRARPLDERLHRRAADMLKELDGVDRLSSRPDNVRYHIDEITDASYQFDEVETTVSHAYSVPSAGLQGRTYGEAFFDRSADLDAFRAAGTRILEIGCGTGRFARAFLDRFATQKAVEYRASHYTMFDLSPTLAASQRDLCQPHAEHITHRSGNVETYDFGESFDLILCNEMIADLAVHVTSRGAAHGAAPGPACVAKYRLDCEGAMDRFLVNTGAIKVIEQIAAVLRPAGHAIVTEYGSKTSFPQPRELGRHTEHSIHFGHLEQAARALGLEAECESLTSFLRFDPRHEVIAGASAVLLRAVSPRFFGRPLRGLAYDRSQLRGEIGDAFDRIGNLVWLPLGDRKSFATPARFLALSLRRSA
jgi:SAM-dependent methyltransferase